MRRWRGTCALRRTWVALRAGAVTWVVPGEVAATRYPRNEGALRALATSGVTLIVNVHERPLPEPTLAGLGMRTLHLPVPDMSAPTLAQLEIGVRAIQSATEARERVAVNCGAGLGRTGTLLAALLVARGASASDAIGAVRSRRPGSIETAEQEHAVHAYEARLRGVGRGPDD